jgi:peptide/nickel transport system ATP-binding protein
MFFECKKLTIYNNRTKLVDVSFRVDSKLALVGQSGSGKSLILKAILGLCPDNLDVEFEYESDFEYSIGDTISYVPQNPFTSLSPMTKIKNHFTKKYDEICFLFELVDLDISLLQRYPSELSGGELQRVVIALSLENNPKLLLLDEPTTSLDQNIKNRVLDIICSLQSKLNFLILFVSHDFDSVEKICDECVVLKNGKIVENSTTNSILNNPKDDYTKLLIESNLNNRGFRC